MDDRSLIFDSHQHFWQVGRFDYPWMSPDIEVLYQDYLPAQLQPILESCGVRKTVLVQASNSRDETRWLLKLAEQYSFIAGVVGWVDLTAESCGDQLDEFTAHPRFKGVRHLVESEPEDDWLAQPSVIKNLRRLATRGVTYDLLVHTRHLRHAITAAESCPDLRFVLDHLAKPPIATRDIDEWARELKPLAALPNVWCKLSGLVTEAIWTGWQTKDLQPYVDVALDYFGPERMMFGSDWPVCLLASSYERVLETAHEVLVGLSAKERKLIFLQNAVEVYRIEDQIWSAAA